MYQIIFIMNLLITDQKSFKNMLKMTAEQQKKQLNLMITVKQSESADEFSSFIQTVV